MKPIDLDTEKLIAEVRYWLTHPPDSKWINYSKVRKRILRYVMQFGFITESDVSRIIAEENNE